MKHVKILGTGCAKCKKTEEVVRNVIAADHLDATVEKVEDIQAIMAYNVLMTILGYERQEAPIPGSVVPAAVQPAE